MSLWLILSPLFAWVTFGTLGYHLLRKPVASIWAGMQITTAKRAYDPSLLSHRAFAVQIRAIGIIAILAPTFLTIMALLVAAGVVAPAKN